MGAGRVLYKIASGIGEREETEALYGRASLPPLASKIVPISKNNPMQTELSEAYRYRDELLEDMKERKKKGEPIPEALSDAERLMLSTGLDIRSIPRNVSRDKYGTKSSYKKYKKELTPKRR